MRIATFNVNSIKARLKFVRHWLEARKPDVACLQELKVPDEKFPHAVFEELGYQAAVHGQRQWNGVAILTRNPAEVVQAGLPGAEEVGARLLTVRTGDLLVTSVYVPNGKSVDHEDYGVKLDFLARLGDFLQETHDPSGRAVVGGDFNLTPGDLDTCDIEANAGHIHHTEAERAALQRMLDLGFADLYRARNPDGRMFSWWDYRAGAFHKNLGLRIDLLLATPAVLEATGEVWIDRDYRKKKDGEIPSDHAPVIADLADLKD